MPRLLGPVFSTVRTEGMLFPPDFLQRIALYDSSLAGLNEEAYHRYDEKLHEAVTNSWAHLLRVWNVFREHLVTASTIYDAKTSNTLTKERWLQYVFSALYYGHLPAAKPLEIGDRYYSISHSWNHSPIHLVGFQKKLDEYSEQIKSKTRLLRCSPHGLVQDCVNHTDRHAWGIVSNGLRLRLLHSSMRLTRHAYIEFDLEAMMQGELYTDFILFWLLCHQSRLEGAHPADCWLEHWTQTAQAQEIRALDQLHTGVEKAISILGSGFLAHRANQKLCDKLRMGQLNPQDYYRQILRLVYRLIVLFVAEDRELLFSPDADPLACERYKDYYSTSRLRRLAERHAGTHHSDLFRALRLVMLKLGQSHGCPELGLPALNGFLFSSRAMPDLEECDVANHYLLDAIRALAFTSTSHTRRAVDYKNLGSEELGSIYEALLERHPVLNIGAAAFELQTAKGNERKTSGGYYTPTQLIDSLLDTALEPVLEEACQKPNPEQAILNLKVCDPACGSGHFLVAAAHRIARRLAVIRSQEGEPTPEERRKALRDVVGSCLYGVDINPMSVELCRVSLWMESVEPGKPFTFFDHHIQCGNSLLGATPALLAEGIPDSAFEPIEGDSKDICREYRRRNKAERKGQLRLPWEQLDKIVISAQKLKAIDDGTFEGIHRIEDAHNAIIDSPEYRYFSLLANAWCAAFVCKKVKGSNPITENILRTIKETGRVSVELEREINLLAEQYQFFHWYLAFPDVFRIPASDEEAENEQAGWCGGFDVVLSNPPWERIKLQEKEWFAKRRPDIADATNAAQRHSMIAALAADDPALYAAFLDDRRQAEGESHLVRASGRYPLCGRGDVNTYALFAETMRLLISSTGRVGCIVPSGVATDETAKYFFQDLIDSGTLVSLYDLDNTEAIFPAVDSRFKFCLLSLTGPARPARHGSDFAFFLHSTEDLQEHERHCTLSSKDITLMNPNTHTCPIFRSKKDMSITKAIYIRANVLIKDGPPTMNVWSISFHRLFDMANSSHLFRTCRQLEMSGWVLKGNVFHKDGEKHLPLYEGKMISHYDHRFSGYKDHIRVDDTSTSEHNDPLMLAMPHYWIHESLMPHLMADGRKAFLAFRDVARSTDIRTALFSIIPVVPCGHTLPIVILSSKHAREMMYLTSCTSSFVFDYTARQKLGGTHMTFFILKQLPVLAPERYTTPCSWESTISLGDWILPRVLELTYTAWDLEAFAQDCGYDGPPFRWDEERRFLLRCELDAAYFHLYGIEREDVGYIMETFPIKDKDQKVYGEYRTKSMILQMYDEMKFAMDVGEPYTTHLVPPPAHPSVAHRT